VLLVRSDCLSARSVVAQQKGNLLDFVQGFIENLLYSETQYCCQ